MELADCGFRGMALASEMRFDVALVGDDLGDVPFLDVLGRLEEEQPWCVRVLVSGNMDLSGAVNAVNTGEVPMSQYSVSRANRSWRFVFQSSLPCSVKPARLPLLK